MGSVIHVKRNDAISIVLENDSDMQFKENPAAMMCEFSADLATNDMNRTAAY